MKNFKVLLVYPNLMLVSLLPNNIALLAACLKKKGCDVKLFDATLYKTTDKTNDEMRVERMQVRRFNIKEAGQEIKERDIYDDFATVVREYKPDLIAVSVVDDTVEMGLDFIRHANCKNIPVVFGGVYAIFNPQKLIELDEVDYVCTGEGEESLIELCDCLENSRSCDEIKNLWISKSDGSVIKNELRPPVELDELPYEDFSIFEKNRIFRPMQGKMLATIPINFDRGCPYKCTFCAAPALFDMHKKHNYKYYRVKSIDRVRQEMRHHIDQFPVSFFYFNSETFLTMPLKKLEEFAEMYSEFQLPFWCQTRIETISEDKVRILKQMNCERISIGLEHGNEEFRKKVLKKNFTNQQAIEAFDILHKQGIKVSVNNIIGFPDETRDLVFDTIKLNRQITVDSTNGFVFQPYRGTYLREYCIKKGYLYDDYHGTESFIGSPIGNSILSMPQFTQEQIEGMLRTFVLYVKMPENYYPLIEEAEKLTKEGDAALEKLRDIFFNEYFD